jgi:SAM-dependent methyltransferase
MSADRHGFRRTFEEVAALYDVARPLYPAGLFDDLVALTGLRARDRIVEIGCGTGQATRPLAERGLEIVCVELGEQLAALARRKLAEFPAVAVVNESFETWEPEHAAFDAVVAFTAFHWINPDVRYEKTARLLRHGGSLGVVQTQHVTTDDGEGFWSDVQEDYDAIMPGDDNRPPPRPAEVADLSAEIAASGLFRQAVVRRHLWDVRYSADEYIAVLETYSGHRALDDASRQSLYERIRSRIGAQPDRHVTKSYLAILNVAQRAKSARRRRRSIGR